jgi:hypothetical protein
LFIVWSCLPLLRTLATDRIYFIIYHQKEFMKFLLSTFVLLSLSALPLHAWRISSVFNDSGATVKIDKMIIHPHSSIVIKITVPDDSVLVVLSRDERYRVTRPIERDYAEIRISDDPTAYNNLKIEMR